MIDEIMTVDEAAKILDVHRVTITKFAKKSKIWFRIGRKYRINKSDWDKWLDELRANKNERKN